MEARLNTLLIALACFRDALGRGEHSLRSARHALARFRLTLLRLRLRPIAILLSEGCWSRERMPAAVEAAILALQAEVQATQAA
jgi:hypothetical protein